MGRLGQSITSSLEFLQEDKIKTKSHDSDKTWHVLSRKTKMINYLCQAILNQLKKIFMQHLKQWTGMPLKELLQ